MKSTRDRLIERYNSYSRRGTIKNSQTKKNMFTSFKRTLGPWLPVTKEISILDIACGEGSLLYFLFEEGFQNLSGFDFSPENVKICHDVGLDFVQQYDALKIDELYPGKTFDIIFVIDFLEHIPKPFAADFLEQVNKKLNPGGSVVIQTPNMGSVLGLYHRYYDLSHEFGVTEKSALDLMLISGFDQNHIEIRPAWNATTPLGYLREAYLKLSHFLTFIAEGSSRPIIPTKNLLIRGIKN